MIKINAGFTKKVPGNQDYSSEGVHVTLEMELPDSYLGNKQALQLQIQDLITEARDQVEQQLGGNSQQFEPFEQPNQPNQTNRNGRFQTVPPPRPASNKQLNFLLSLAKRARNLGPQDICERFQITNLQELSSRQASEMIEQLKTGATAVPRHGGTIDRCDTVSPKRIRIPGRG